MSPHFSPDGETIAFTWRHEGANDIFVVRAAGGAPVQLTHGPSTSAYDNLVTGWTPDGGSVLFLSHRNAALRKHFETYAVPTTGGLATPLGIDHSGLSSMSPDGARIAYDWSFRNLGGDRWKRYRGGQAGEIFIYDLLRRRLDRVTTWIGTDTAPMWWRNRIYFLSDRGPEQRLNIWSIDLDSRAVRQITHFMDYDIDMPSIGPGGIAFQEGGRVHLIDLPSETVHDVQITTSEPTIRPRKVVSGVNFLRLQDIASTPDFALGKSPRVAYVSAHGDLFAVGPDGSSVNVTRTAGVEEDHPSVSPDGKALAFITDADGEQQVAILPLNAASQPRTITHFQSGVLYTPLWSPDGRRLVVADANKRLWIIGAETGHVEQVASDPYAEIHDAAFSPDGQSLAYSTTRSNGNRAIHMRFLESGEDVVLSSPLESDHDPAFTSDGKSIFFVSARREYPFVSDRDHEGTIATLWSDGLYRALAPRGAHDRIEIFQTSAQEVPEKIVGGISNLAIKNNILFYHETALNGIDGKLPGQIDRLHAFNVTSVADQVISTEVDDYILSPDGTEALVASGDDLKLITIRNGLQRKTRTISLSKLKIQIDPDADHREMFEQAWRLDRDLFWDPKLNGVDWSAIHDRYALLVSRLRSQEDMTYLLGEMQGELSASHMFITPGPVDTGSPRTTTALIGVDFVLDSTSGRYRMAHIYRGDATRERFRAPLWNPAFDVQDGDYLLAVDGDQLQAPDDPYRLLTNKKGTLRLTVSRNPDGPARTIHVIPIDDESEIRKLDWIEINRTIVNKFSGGQIGYIYLSDFNELGSEDFLRQYYAQIGKGGLVIDVRDNLGGFASQWVLGALRRLQAGVFRNREGAEVALPESVSPRKIVTVTDIFSSSDGDQFPYYFSLWHMGPVVGERTWGGVRGIKGQWRLIDATAVTIPKDSLLTPDGDQIIENKGSEPSIAIDDNPAMRRVGHDVQLEKAVSVAQSMSQ
ncbi:S41 family peptidase [Acetobacter nitrogenifigens]|uniref:Peptidase S41 n=3 Tax=Acetobacter nitrogenifigens TaxID=285268 RepID=A0A511XEU5_9PROT|nr:S41 family peptidase [Acetobacter nitrogenifigens]GEN61467.1 peptidase S41 [Acetobacter nitrogenifigens DSM 23921 = NBRC 105050]